MENKRKKWKVESGEWKVESGKWKDPEKESGKWKVKEAPRMKIVELRTPNSETNHLPTNQPALTGRSLQ
eukprot:scaffold228_cov312-Pinguiococcus_pyrenoidosus.AAC.11